MTIKDNHSTGWEHLTDLEMAQWYQDHVEKGKYLPLDWLQLEPAGELILRGIKIKPCASCNKTAMVYNHDYICILCRRTDVSP